MNRKAIIGTILWGLILFLIISAFFFYVNFKQVHAVPQKKEETKPEEISVQDASTKSILVLVNKVQDLKSGS